MAVQINQSLLSASQISECSIGSIFGYLEHHLIVAVIVTIDIRYGPRVHMDAFSQSGFRSSAAFGSHRKHETPVRSQPITIG
jgi:hypothetical protein